ncbi:MAG: lipid-A-disaccharide synthase [Sulfitobacter sp.]
MRRFFLLAGEPSGDKLGGALMAGLRQLEPDVTFEGIGGPDMQAQGLRSRFDMSELTLMGIAEILPKYLHLKRRIRETAQAVIDSKPDALITIDAPDFSLRVAALVKAQSNIRCVHYVAPTVWAWRPGRAAKMARHIDHVLALFPFEPPYMQAAGMECDFVGHPIAGNLRVSPEEIQDFQTKHSIDGPSLVMLPGSRHSEIARLGPRFNAAFEQIASRVNTVIVPTLPHLVELVDEHLPLPSAKRRIVVSQSSRTRQIAMATGDVALATSGTVALDLAAARTPMVSAFDLNWLSRQIVQRMVRIDTGNLVNIVSDTRHVPELIGAACTPNNIAAALSNLMDDPQAQLGAMDYTMQALGQGQEAPGLRAARAVLTRL